eukprot:TRINITY_DN5825_c0_g2_i1.p1 TRINITY_DN5825_c0_g2~~TRINITY_DN5825_c0_g2_i1.p1  ORF type:complete len:261 (-),score=79.03 TRINITY_DN5825_c0_g2_i1:117-842(-)
MRGVLALCLVLGLFSLAKAAEECSPTVSGQRFDLSGLATGSDIVIKNGLYEYAFAPCGSAQKTCPANPPRTGSLVQSQGAFCAILSSWNSPLWSLVDIHDPWKGLQATFSNGDAGNCPGGRNRALTAVFTCDASASGDSFVISEPSPCSYKVVLNSKYGCPVGGLSSGWTFVIVVIGSFVAYIVAGCVYKRSRLGVTDWKESIPNIDFWQELPGLVKDGVMFSYSKIRGICGPRENTYQDL